MTLRGPRWCLANSIWRYLVGSVIFLAFFSLTSSLAGFPLLNSLVVLVVFRSLEAYCYLNLIFLWIDSLI